MQIILRMLKDIQNKPVYINTFTSKIPYLEQDMENQRINNIVVPMIAQIEVEINGIIFHNIKLCKNVQEANMYFELLDEIQGVLGRLWIVENVDLSAKMQGFVHDCERLDDPWLLDELFKEIQDGTYNYNLLKPS